MQNFQNMLVELATSKKFNALMAAVLTVLSQDTEPGLFVMSEKTVMGIVAPVIAYLIAQGQADKGKSAAKISASPRPPRVPTT